jgi:hypothetical protein
MDYPLSRNLAELPLPRESDEPLDLQALAGRAAEQFANKSPAAHVLLARVTGRMLPGTLCRHLFDCIAHDCAVRDVLTTGHLAKLLSRLDVLKETSNPRIVGLPHSLFDERSQAERAEYFRRGGVLWMDADLLQVNCVKQMLQREKGEA